MVKYNPFNPVDKNKINPFNPVTNTVTPDKVSPQKQTNITYGQKASNPFMSLLGYGEDKAPAQSAFSFQHGMTSTSPANAPMAVANKQTTASKYGLPESTISQAQPAKAEKEPTGREQVMQAEEAKQFYWGGEKSAVSGFIDSMTDWDRKDVPYIGSGIEAVDLVKVATAASRFEKGKQTQKDIDLLDEYFTNADKEAKLNKNKGYSIGETIKGSLRFMGELAIIAATEIFSGSIAPTGDAYVLGQVSKLGARKTLEKMTKDKVFKASVNKAVKSKVKKESALLAKQFAFTAPTNVTGLAAERMIGAYDLDTGEVIEEGKNIGEATVNAITQHAVELATERGGGITGKILGKMAAPLKKIVVKTAIYQALMKVFPKATNAQLTAILSKSGWNGTIGEFFEERDADVLNQLLFKMGLGDQEFTGLTLDQISTELIAFSIMGGGINASQRAVERLTRKTPNVPAPPAPLGGIPTVTDITPPPPPSAGQTQIVDQEIQAQPDTTDEFFTTKTDLSFYDDAVKSGEGKIVYMSPDEYIDAIVKYKKTDAIFGEVREMTREELVGSRLPDMPKRKEYFDSQIAQGEKINALSIESNFDDVVGQEGLHRALWAKEKGIKKLPVVIVDRNNKLKQISDSEAMTKGPGYQKFSNYVDTMVENGTVFPEEAVILKTLFEGTDDKLLADLRFEDNPRLSMTLGRFKAKRGLVDNIIPGSQKIEMQKGLANKGIAQASKVFVHEFGHAGFNMVLTNNERVIVDKVFEEMTKSERIQLFSELGGNVNYYASNPQEFFAEAFAGYIFENKVPATQMEPLLKRMANEFYRRLRNLVIRGEQKSVEIMQPLFEKILAGDTDTPLAKFLVNESPSFKKELQSMFKQREDVPPEDKSLFATAPTKEVPVETLAPDGNSPADMAAKAREEAIQGLPPDIAATIEPLEPVIAGEKNTPLSQQVGMLDYLRTPWRVFEKMGLRPVYQKLLAGYDAYMQELPKNIDKITEWSKRVSKESNKKIFQFLDGNKDIELDANEAQVASEIKSWLEHWADRLGMKKDARITDYITHIFPAGRGGEIPEEIAYMIRDKIPGSTYNPFLLQRLGAEGYVEDTWKALDAYAKRATRKANMDPGLAELKKASDKLTNDTQLDYINSYVSKINLRPNKIDKMIDTSIKQLLGYKLGVRPTANLTRSIRMTIARAKIGFSMTSFAKNLTQGVNTFAELGSKYTTIGYVDLVKFGSKELDANNVLIAPFIEDRKYSAVKGALEKADRVAFLNMNASELINRGAAYYGAKAKFVDGKIKPKEYRMAFGKEMPTDYTPTLEDAVEYGKFVAAKTQFKFGALDTPVAMNSDLMKMVFQFQTFSLKQGEFIAQMAVNKEYAKLSKYMVASTMLFQLIGSAFGMSWWDALFPWRFGLPPAIQFFADLFKGGVTGKDKYGNVLNAKDRSKAVAGTLFTNVVPGGAQMKRTAEGLGVVNEGASRTKGGNFQYKVDKTPSNYIRGSLWGKYNLPASKEYYKKKEDKAKGKSSKSSSRSSTNPFNPN